MKSIKLKAILAKTGGRIVQGDTDITITRVVKSAKKLSSNTLLFHLTGKTVSCPPERLKELKHCAVITKTPRRLSSLGKKITVIEVNDVTKAYWAFVTYYRSLFNCPVIGITGTCGKSTTKDMVKHILQSKYHVLATKRSRNDLNYNLGYLTEMDESTEVAVIEMGVAWPGDLLNYAKYFKTKVGVITKIGIDHLLGCKSEEGYLKAKAQMLKCLSYTGMLILNADDENIRKIDLSPFKGKIIYFGVGRKAEFRASGIRYYRNGMKYTLHYKGRAYRCFIPGLGEHNVYNALAAIAAVHAIGFNVHTAAKLLRTFKHLESHLQIRQGIKNCMVIDDTWSTNPTSLEAALAVLKTVGRNRKNIVVLGYIDELGEHSAFYHSLVGEKIANMGIDLLITLGKEAEVIAKRAIEKGMSPNKVYCCKNSDEVFNVVAPILNNKSVLLVKKSMHVSFKDLMRKFIIT